MLNRSRGNGTIDNESRWYETKSRPFELNDRKRLTFVQSLVRFSILSIYLFVDCALLVQAVLNNLHIFNRLHQKRSADPYRERGQTPSVGQSASELVRLKKNQNFC